MPTATTRAAPGPSLTRAATARTRPITAVEGGERECGCGRRATTASFIPNRQGLRRHAGQQGVVPRCKHTYTGSLPVTRTRSLLPQSFLTSLAGCLLMPVVSSYELRRYLRYASRSSLCSSLLLFPLTTPGTRPPVMRGREPTHSIQSESRMRGTEQHNLCAIEQRLACTL